MEVLAELEKRLPNVLVVDDMESNLELLETIFTKSNMNVYKALNGEQALEIFRTESIDIVILDVMMPGIDGFQVCNMLKSMAGKRYVPIILLTALNDKRSRITGIECGADDFISKPFDSTELLTKMRALLRLKALYDELENSENIIMTLAIALETKDPYTRGHSTRVSSMASRFAAYLEMSDTEQEILRKAGLLHDIGKIGINENLLHKPERLTNEELELVKKHVIIGEEICRPLTSLKPILPLIRYHHERWDGTGFPDCLKAESIPILARILSIIDSYDAMTSVRPYRDGLPHNVVIDIMKKEEDSGQWDPYLLREFISFHFHMRDMP